MNIKAKFVQEGKQEMRRFKVNSYSEFVSNVLKFTGKKNIQEVEIQYRDADNDLITISSEGEFFESPKNSKTQENQAVTFLIVPNGKKEQSKENQGYKITPVGEEHKEGVWEFVSWLFGFFGKSYTPQQWKIRYDQLKDKFTNKGITCSKCKKTDFCGEFFRCNDCQTNFDLCKKCFKKGKKKHCKIFETHSFSRFSKYDDFKFKDLYPQEQKEVKQTQKNEEIQDPNVVEIQVPNIENNISQQPILQQQMKEGENIYPTSPSMEDQIKY